MPGYVIHLAIGEEYLKMYPDEIKNYKDFIDGIIYPDTVEDKSKTHYGPKTSRVNLRNFFFDRDINTDFNKGMFLHLVTDYLFYNKFLKKFSKQQLHDDYDILNKELEKEFQVKIPDKIKGEIFYKEGKTKILDIEKINNFIRETAKNNLNDIKISVLNNDKEWLTIRSLNH